MTRDKLAIGLGMALALATGATVGHLLLPRDVAAADPTPTVAASKAPKTERPDPFAPSRAWLHAGPEQRVEAYAVMVAEVGADQTCMRDVQHSYQGLFKDTGKEHADTPSKLHPGEHHQYDEYVQGVCDGPGADGGWSKVDREFADALAEGGSKDDATRKWEECLYLEGDTTWIACPDGYWTSS